MVTLTLKIAQKPYRIGSLGPKDSKYESLEPFVVRVMRRAALRVYGLIVSRCFYMAFMVTISHYAISTLIDPL